MKNKKILVVGGGFRGIVISDRLSKTNNVDLIEKFHYIGGVLFQKNGMVSILIKESIFLITLTMRIQN